jgi:hypothetical protein
MRGWTATPDASANLSAGSVATDCLPSVVREVQEESHVGDVPLRRRERLNAQLRDTFERCSECLDLLRRRGVAVAPGAPA